MIMKKVEVFRRRYFDITGINMTVVFLVMQLLFFIPPASGQVEEKKTIKYRPAQLSLIYPLGTNGVNTNIVNNVSFNLFGGVQGGVNGLEAGGFFNADKYDVRGFQAAGFLNVAGRNVRGGQFAGFANVNGGSVYGVSAGGFLNITGDSLKGLQAAGFVNILGNAALGVQLAGFANIVDGSIDFLQMAGFFNTSRGIRGLQGAGFINVNDGYSEGFQIAGFSNITTRDVKGVQLSGLLNYARHVRGFQFALINISDSIHGVPLGLINIVIKNGFRKFEIWGSESLYANLAYKMGVKQLYTVYFVGMQPSARFMRWGAGLGLGTEITLTGNKHLNIEGLVSHINENEFWTRDLNLLNQLRLNFDIEVSDHFAVAFGPAFNLMVSRYINVASGRKGSSLPPWTIINTNNKKSNIKFWPGFNFGFKIG